MGAVPLVRVTRGGLTESIHAGHVAVCDADGTLVAWAGDPDRMIYARSCMKPLQATVSLTAIAEALPDREIAVIAASHNGEPIHVGTVRAVLERAGLDAGRAEEPARLAARCRVDGGLAAQAQAAAQLLGQARGHAARVRASRVGPRDVPAGQPPVAAPRDAAGAARDRHPGPDDGRGRMRRPGARHAAALDGHVVRAADGARTPGGRRAGRRPCDRGDAVRALPGRRPPPRGHRRHAGHRRRRREVRGRGAGVRRRPVVGPRRRREDRRRRQPRVGPRADPRAAPDRRAHGGPSARRWRSTRRLPCGEAGSPSGRSKPSSTCAKGARRGAGRAARVRHPQRGPARNIRG